MGETIQYYEDNAQSFIDNTLLVDMSDLYQQFLPLLPEGSAILDAGCGTGRDTLYFKKQGFQVSAFDGSSSMAEFASQLSGISVKVARFEEVDYQHQFDGIWACASLLHVPADRLPVTFNHLASQLKQGGLLYCSFKYGDDDQSRGGRDFTNATEARLAEFITSTPLTLQHIWVTSDRRPGRESEQWLNAIVRRRVA